MSQNTDNWYVRYSVVTQKKSIRNCNAVQCTFTRGKSLLESRGTTFLPDWHPPNLCLIYFKITWAPAILLEHMHKKFEINRTKIKGGCQSGRKGVTHDSKNDLPLGSDYKFGGQWNKYDFCHTHRYICFVFLCHLWCIPP